MAASPDGSVLYAIDKFSANLGAYDVMADSFSTIGTVKIGATPVTGIVLAATSPQGVLYVASDDTDNLYTIDTTTALATSLGHVYNGSPAGAFVNISGADLVFGSDGVLYLWTNSSKSGAPNGT